MAALMIVNYDVTDREALDAYRKAAAPVFLGMSGVSVVAMTEGTVDLGEGGSPGAETVVLRFESLEAAQAAYKSEAYQAVLGDRLTATTPKFAIIVETAD